MPGFYVLARLFFGAYFSVIFFAGGGGLLAFICFLSVCFVPEDFMKLQGFPVTFSSI